MDCRILSSVIEFAVIEDHVEMGPYCHLRKGAHLASHVHMGNFGEVKDSYLGEGTKMGHFSYIGNADIAGNVNIGAGTITCNYDGKSKHPTIIEEGCFHRQRHHAGRPCENWQGSQDRGRSCCYQGCGTR